MDECDVREMVQKAGYQLGSGYMGLPVWRKDDPTMDDTRKIKVYRDCAHIEAMVSHEELKRFLLPDLPGGSVKELPDDDPLPEIAAFCSVAFDDAPERPGNTCPDIDKTISALKGIGDKIRDAVKILQENDLENPFRPQWPWESPDQDIDQAIDMLEDLRKKNDALRQNGTHFYHAVEEIRDYVGGKLVKRVAAEVAETPELIGTEG